MAKRSLGAGALGVSGSAALADGVARPCFVAPQLANHVHIHRLHCCVRSIPKDMRVWPFRVEGPQAQRPVFQLVVYDVCPAQKRGREFD
eukprot:1789093-Rhodomonas_salina.1